MSDDTFNPDDHKPDPTKQSGDDKFLERAGDYLLAFTWAGQVGENKNGKLNVRMKAEVIAGPEAGRIVFDSVYLTPASYQRLGALCAAMGQREPFRFTDSEIRRALLFKPFKCSVKMESYDGQRRGKLGFVKPEVSPEERETMDTWVLENAEERAASAATRGGAADEWGGAPLPDDDDIAF